MKEIEIDGSSLLSLPTLSEESSHVVMVPDRYDNLHSIKTAERIRRQKNNTQEIQFNDNLKIPNNFQLYLSNQRNKINLVNYLFQHWKETLPNLLSLSHTVYLGNLDGTSTLIKKECCVQLDLICDHEGADTKMFAYIMYIIQQSHIERVILQSTDTDVAVISL